MSPTPVNKKPEPWPPPPSDQIWLILIGAIIGAVGYQFVMAVLYH